MAYGDFKELTRRTASDKGVLLQWFIKVLIKNPLC